MTEAKPESSLYFADATGTLRSSVTHGPGRHLYILSISTYSSEILVIARWIGTSVCHKTRNLPAKAGTCPLNADAYA